jgi:hypothetical protein
MSTSSSSSTSSTDLSGAEAAAVEYTLLGFHQYLVLERMQQAGSSSSSSSNVSSEVLVLVPAGPVVHTADGASIKLGTSANTRIQVS